ncbi:hypothetical protein BH23CHL8_BH23CHL8_17330 [soil metagenome]
MAGRSRVELQAEVDGRREALFELVSTSTGLRRWLDDADVQPARGSACRFRLAGGVAVGRVLAVAAPQHVSYSWDWEAEPLAEPSVVAFDLIDHGRRTHFTLRHVGFHDEAQLQLHEALWRHWFGRLLEAAARPQEE